MEKPIINGAKFGLSAALVFGLVSFALKYASLSVDELLYEPLFGELLVVRNELLVRDGVFIVLATVRNGDEVQIAFDAEAVIFGSDGELLDTCHTDRTFELAPSAELSFVATCAVGPEGDTDFSVQAERATLQFY